MKIARMNCTNAEILQIKSTNADLFSSCVRVTLNRTSILLSLIPNRGGRIRLYVHPAEESNSFPCLEDLAAGNSNER